MTQTCSRVRAVCHAMSASTMSPYQRPVRGHISRIEELSTTSLSAVADTGKDSATLYTLR